MAAFTQPALRLQPKHTNRPYGGGWWPSQGELSHQLVDLVKRWPADRPSIVRYAFLHDDWDRSEAEVPTRHRTRTVILVLEDRSICRLLVIPHDAGFDVVERMLEEASDPHSTWQRMDFASTDLPSSTR